MSVGWRRRSGRALLSGLDVCPQDEMSIAALIRNQDQPHNRPDLREGYIFGSKVIRRKLSDCCLHRFITVRSFSRNSFGSRNYHM